MSKWIRTGDKVVVNAGSEKGQSGKILRINGERVVIEGLNIRKKHVKAQQDQRGGIVEMEASMHRSNIQFCNEAGKAVKVKIKFTAAGAKQLIYTDGGKEVVIRDVKKK